VLRAAEVEVSGLMYSRTLNLEVVLGAGGLVVVGGLGGGLEGAVEVMGVDLTISIHKSKAIWEKEVEKGSEEGEVIPFWNWFSGNGSFIYCWRSLLCTSQFSEKTGSSSRFIGRFNLRRHY